MARLVRVACSLSPAATGTNDREVHAGTRVVRDRGPPHHVPDHPARLHAWLRRIDDWIAYANSVVAE